MPKINLQRKKAPESRTHNRRALLSFYNTPRWKRLRALKFAENPLCEVCYQSNIIRQADEIHHIIPIDINNPIDELIFDYDNLKSVCKECHVGLHNHLRKKENPVERLISERREVR